MFSLIYARINGWVNNGEAGDLRRHRAHYDVIVMNQPIITDKIALKFFVSNFVIILSRAKTDEICNLTIRKSQKLPLFYVWLGCINTLRPRQNGRHFPDDIFKLIFLNQMFELRLTFHKGPINNIPALVQIMAWRRPGDKPLSEIMLASLLTYICVTGLNELTLCPTKTCI